MCVIGHNQLIRKVLQYLVQRQDSKYTIIAPQPSAPMHNTLHTSSVPLATPAAANLYQCKDFPGRILIADMTLIS